MGSPATKLVISKVPPLVVSQTLGRTGNAVVQTIQDEFAHSGDGVQTLGPLLGSENDLAVTIHIFPLREVVERAVVVQLCIHRTARGDQCARSRPSGTGTAGNMT